MSGQSRQVQERYQSEDAALRYQGVHRGRRRHLREARCLRRALRTLEPGDRVLDLPCGTGRMFATLASLGLEVTAADASVAMVALAMQQASNEPAVREVRVEDAFETRFEDGAFEAVVCNRLLHHLRLCEDRVSVLAELGRISSRLVVASFFCTSSIEAARARLFRALGKPASERGAIPYARFRREARAAGLRVCEVIPTLAPVSQQWYVVATHDRR